MPTPDAQPVPEIDPAIAAILDATLASIPGVDRPRWQFKIHWVRGDSGPNIAFDGFKHGGGFGIGVGPGPHLWVCGLLKPWRRLI